MNVQIKPGFLFPTQFWTAKLNENIEQLHNEAYLIRKNDKEGVRKSNSGFQGYHSNDIRDLITDFSLLGLTTMNMKELITIYALIVAISLVMRLIYFNIQKHGGLKLAKISINKNKKIPGAGKFLPDGTKTLKPESEGEFKIKKLRMCNKRFGITNGFFGNFLLILLFLVGIYFLSVNIFLVLIALVSLNYIIVINLNNSF